MRSAIKKTATVAIIVLLAVLTLIVIDNWPATGSSAWPFNAISFTSSQAFKPEGSTGNCMTGLSGIPFGEALGWPFIYSSPGEYCTETPAKYYPLAILANIGLYAVVIGTVYWLIKKLIIYILPSNKNGTTRSTAKK